MFRSFFFSSRRRHTRSYGDWSSDVCSSDLLGDVMTTPRACCNTRGPVVTSPNGSHSAKRSEERRVGKECRASDAEHWQKKRRIHDVKDRGVEKEQDGLLIAVRQSMRRQKAK